MSKRVFADSNFFIGSLLPNNSLHSSCHQLITQYHQENFRPCTSYSVVAEVLTVLRLRATQKAVETAARTFTRGDIKLLSSNPDLEKLSLKLFLHDKKHKLSFVDASIITLIEYEGIENLITFDQHLATIAESRGIQVLR